MPRAKSPRSSERTTIVFAAYSPPRWSNARPIPIAEKRPSLSRFGAERRPSLFSVYLFIARPVERYFVVESPGDVAGLVFGAATGAGDAAFTGRGFGTVKGGRAAAWLAASAMRGATTDVGRMNWL